MFECFPETYQDSQHGDVRRAHYNHIRQCNSRCCGFDFFVSKAMSLLSTICLFEGTSDDIPPFGMNSSFGLLVWCQTSPAHTDGDYHWRSNFSWFGQLLMMLFCRITQILILCSINSVQCFVRLLTHGVLERTKGLLSCPLFNVLHAFGNRSRILGLSLAFCHLVQFLGAYTPDSCWCWFRLSSFGLFPFWKCFTVLHHILTICKCSQVQSWGRMFHHKGPSRTSSHVLTKRGRALPSIVALIAMCLMHSGEAANPGPIDSHPTWTIGAFNPSGLNGKQKILSDHLGYGDIWSIAETHLSSSAMQAFKKGLQSGGSSFKYCIGGNPTALRPHSEHAGAWTGVAVVSKHPTRAVSGPFSDDIFASSRIQMTTTLCHDMWVTGITLYGEPPGQHHPNAAHNTELLVDAATEAIGNVRGLRFVSGDFNFEIDQLEGFNKLHQLGFKDLQTLANERWGVRPSPTCKGVTRKDFLFISPELQSLLDTVSLEHDVWADHSVIVGRFRLPSSDCVTPLWRMPRPLEWPEGFRDSPPFVQVSFHDTDPTEAYRSLWQQTEAYASSRIVASNSYPLRSQLGRGQTMQTTDQRGTVNPMHLKPSRKGDITPQFVGSSAQHSQWFRQLRRLQSYVRFRSRNPSDTLDLHGASLWRSILCARGFNPSFAQWWGSEGSTLLDGAPLICPLLPPSLQVAEGIFYSFSHAVRQLESRLKGEKQKAARKLRLDMPHMIFRDIKRVAPERIDIFVKSTSATVASIDELDSAIELEQAVQFDMSRSVFINGREFDLLNADPTLIHIDDASAISVGDTVTQTSATGKFSDMFELFGREWSSRWDRRQHVPSSQWEQILDFSKHHLPNKPALHSPIVVTDLLEEVKRKKVNSASGPDGVSVLDLRSMPECVTLAHCDLFSRAERDGTWPEQTLVGRVASLAKVEQPSQVKHYRPITVLSQCYRLWGGLRSRELLRHVDDLCPLFLFGNRPGCHAMQLWMYVQWMIEAAHVSAQPLAGIQADIQKAFNHLPREVILQACLLLGMPSQTMIAWAGALSGLQRRFQIREATGPAMMSSTGCPEGCAMSCLGMLVVDILFHKWIETQCQMAQPLSFVDDWQILTHEPDLIPQALAALEQFTTVIDLQLDPDKTFVWSPNANIRQMFRDGHFRYCNQAKSLGAQMQYTRRHAAKVLVSRIEEVQRLWPRLRASPSPYKQKIRSLRVAAWPQAFHGIAASTLGNWHFQKARAGALKGINSNGSGCNSLVHLGLIEAPNTDPWFWSIHETFRSVRDSHSQQAVAPLIQLALDHTAPLPRGGPTNALLGRIQSLGWEVLSDMHLMDMWGTFSFFDISFPELVCRAERAWLDIVAASVSDRACFSDLGRADPRATRQFLASLSVSDQAIYRKALNGAHFTNDFCYHFSDSGSTLCDHCGQQDSRMHRFWHCPCFEVYRSTCPSDVRKAIDELPVCVTTAGWSLRAATTDQWMSMLQNVQIPEAQPAAILDEQIGATIDLFTDGSCFWPDTPAYRTASWAVTYAAPELNLTKSHVIHSGQLPGIQQTAFRAEIFGVLQALKWCRQWKFSPRIWTDCLGVVRRCRKLLSRPTKLPINIPHGDLWRQIQEEIISLGPQHVTIAKVAAHQRLEDAQTPVDYWCFLHNSLADRAARLSNLLRTDEFWQFHRRHAQEVELAWHISQCVQQVILDISRAVVVRDEAYSGIPDDSATIVPEGLSRLRKEGQWQGASFPLVLPPEITGKFGFRMTSQFVGWVQQALRQATQECVEPAWISFSQLYIDYQMSTGEPGPICIQSWIDAAVRPSVLLRKFPFKKRCAWFTRMFKFVFKAGGNELSVSTVRPSSVILQLHLPSLWIPWPTIRLEMVEQWFTSHLDRSATRAGSCLNGLPFAKRDGRWPKFDIPSRPLCL